MKKIYPFLIILYSVSNPLLATASTNLDGWGEFKFGMTTAQVLEKTGPIIEKNNNSDGTPIVTWKALVLGQNVDVIAFLPNDTLNGIKINFPVVRDGSPEECFQRITNIVDELSKKYGTPDEPLSRYGSGVGGNISWHAIFRFNNGAKITADSGFTPASTFGLYQKPPECDYDVEYYSQRLPSKGL